MLLVFLPFDIFCSDVFTCQGVPLSLNVRNFNNYSFIWLQVLRTGGFVKDCINTILTSTDSKEELVKNLEIIHSKVRILISKCLAFS